MARIHRRTIQKVLDDLVNHDGVVTLLQRDILECEVKWALGNITVHKVSGDNGIPFELFKILIVDAVKVLCSICQQIWKTQQWLQHWKRSAFIPILEKGNAKECSNYQTIVLISYTSKVMLKILQARVQQQNRELADVQARFRKGRGTRNQIANIHWRKQGNSRKIPASLTMLKPLTLCTMADCGKFLKRWEY